MACEYEEFSLDDISLRQLELSDVDDLMSWATDDEVHRYLPWEPYKSRQDGLDFIKKFADPNRYIWAICLKNRVVGAIPVITGAGDGSCRGQLGYVLASKYWGKGFATKAVRMVVSDVFEKWPQLERLQAPVHVENRGSQRVLEKAGFTREGVLRKYMTWKGVTVDVVMFSLLSIEAILACKRARVREICGLKVISSKKV